MGELGAEQYGNILISIDIGKVEVFGEEYISQYVLSEAKKQNELGVLKIYVTDALKLIAENTAKFGGGNALAKRYIDIVDLKETEPQETGEEVKKRLLDKFKKDFGGVRNNGSV